MPRDFIPLRMTTTGFSEFPFDPRPLTVNVLAPVDSPLVRGRRVELPRPRRRQLCATRARKRRAEGAATSIFIETVPPDVRRTTLRQLAWILHASIFAEITSIREGLWPSPCQRGRARAEDRAFCTIEPLPRRSRAVRENEIRNRARDGANGDPIARTVCVRASVLSPAQPLFASRQQNPSIDIGIVGAGIAGLACADALAASGVPATVYEAGDRVGGRCWSLRNLFPGQVAERGGEFIDNLHKTMLRYAPVQSSAGMMVEGAGDVFTLRWSTHPGVHRR